MVLSPILNKKSFDVYSWNASSLLNTLTAAGIFGKGLSGHTNF